MNVEIDRLHIALHGVSALTVEAAADGLEAEIRQRLGAAGSPGCPRPLDIGELSAGPMRSDVVLDAGALRGVIAERLIQTLQQQWSEEPATELE